MHAHQRAFGEGRIERRDPALVDAGEIGADGRARRGVVALARHEHHDRDEAVEAIAPRQHAHARALVEMHDGEHELEQRVLVDLEQLVARVMLQHGRERLAGMAVRIEAGAAHQVVDLAPQIRDGAGRARVDRRGEQADDAEFADKVAVAIEALHPDVVHVHAPVHARFHVRLGDDELLRLLQEFHDLGRDRDQLAAAAQHVHVRRSQDAEPALGNDLIAALVAGQRVFAHAEEGEVVGDQPFEELRRLGDLLDRQRRRIVLDLGDDLADARHHRPPVLHAEAHVGEHAADRLDDLGLPRLVLDALDMDVDEALAPRGADRRTVAAEADQRAGLVALDREDRMQHEPHVDALLGRARPSPSRAGTACRR